MADLSFDSSLVVRIDEEQNLILVKGGIPGGKNCIVRVRMA